MIIQAPRTQVSTIGMFRRCDVSQFPISAKNRLCNIAQSARDMQIFRSEVLFLCRAMVNFLQDISMVPLFKA
jgi:hypothetical protein